MWPLRWPSRKKSLNMATNISKFFTQINNSSVSSSSSTCYSSTTKKLDPLLIHNLRPSLTSLNKTCSYGLSRRTDNAPQALHITPPEVMVVDMCVEECTYLLQTMKVMMIRDE